MPAQTGILHPIKSIPFLESRSSASKLLFAELDPWRSSTGRSARSLFLKRQFLHFPGIHKIFPKEPNGHLSSLIRGVDGEGGRLIRCSSQSDFSLFSLLQMFYHLEQVFSWVSLLMWRNGNHQLVDCKLPEDGTQGSVSQFLVYIRHSIFWEETLL